MRATGKDGKLYGVTFGAEITGGDSATVTTDGWYKIKSKASTGSGIPSKDPLDLDARDLQADDIYWAKATQPLATGDVLIPITTKMLSFVTDTTDGATSSKHDVTTQADTASGSRSYVAGSFAERTGTINGLIETESDEQIALLRNFKKVSVQGESSVSVYVPKQKVQYFMLSRAEDVMEGEREVYDFMPMIIDGVNMDKPMDGTCPFNFNYTVDGQNHPQMIYKVKEA